MLLVIGQEYDENVFHHLPYNFKPFYLSLTYSNIQNAQSKILKMVKNVYLTMQWQ